MAEWAAIISITIPTSIGINWKKFVPKINIWGFLLDGCCHNPILDFLIFFYKNTYFFIKKPKILNPKKSSAHEEISLQDAKDQNTRRIVRLRYFEKMRWRKKENWGWKHDELIKFKNLFKLLTSLIDLFNDLIEEKISLKVN